MAAALYVVLVFVLSLRRTEAEDNTLYVNTTILESAVADGAVCLDGSPPAYHFHSGNGLGLQNWLIFLEGGAWCETILECQDRTNGALGSSKHIKPIAAFTGVLSNDSLNNPDFYNWNRVKIRYCDGSSFTGDIEEVDPATNLHFRGARIFKAIVEELLAKGMSNAQNAILTGTSAGGLAATLNCDKFKDFLPSTARVKCVSDAGFFINVNTIAGKPEIEEKYERVVALHGSTKNLPASCTYTLFIKPSLVNNSFIPRDADPQGIWDNCKDHISKCSPSQLNILHDYRLKFLVALIGLGPSYSRGYFITSCHFHNGIDRQSYWFYRDSPILCNKAIAIAVGDWFYDRSGFKNTDCPYPCGQKFCHYVH